MARTAAALCLAALLLCSSALMAAAAEAEQAGDTPGVASGEAAAVAEGAASATPQQRPPFIVLRHQDNWLLEGLAVAFLLTFLVNMLVGRRRNERLALAWTAEVRWAALSGRCAACCQQQPHACFQNQLRKRPMPRCVHWAAAPLLQLVAPDGVLDRNFALLGPGDTAVRLLCQRVMMPSTACMHHKKAAPCVDECARSCK